MQGGEQDTRTLEKEHNARIIRTKLILENILRTQLVFKNTMRTAGFENARRGTEHENTREINATTRTQLVLENIMRMELGFENTGRRTTLE
ncbi:hypothetical protein E2C01_030903 [Portunus trituberculatus]|uniref:Uncharacterized protein n=1 Tax=Portunus trituberculatus TaxID=210409 RepID=A0A5B7EVF7_PORTR|nr:hypothetical protein [Portunus trituberculatus]